MNAPATRKTSSAQVQVPGTDASVDISHLNAHIATELATGLASGAAIRERYGITPAQWDVLSKNEIFRAMLAEALQKWRGEHNASARIQLKADIVLEDAIATYDGMIHSDKIPASERINAGKLLAQLAGRTANKEGAAGPAHGGFTLNINLANGGEKLVIDGKAIPVNDEPA